VLIVTPTTAHAMNSDNKSVRNRFICAPFLDAKSARPPATRRNATRARNMSLFFGKKAPRQRVAAIEKNLAE
ncbi:hypothetical protein, partial [Pandoraea sp.]|uniref:hypothetical protein n=1 Tax=Pandoraea sp. TaxID=1883445 RepID=UPI0025F5969A